MKYKLLRFICKIFKLDWIKHSTKFFRKKGMDYDTKKKHIETVKLVER